MKKDKFKIVHPEIKDLYFITKYKIIDNLCKTQLFPSIELYADFKEYANTWFFNEVSIRYYKKTNLSLVKTVSLSIIKKCDSPTSLVLNNYIDSKKYGELRIRIFYYDNKYLLQSILTGIDCDFTGNYEERFTGELDDLFIINVKIMEWINSYSIISGQKFLEYCTSLK